jgi:hypothetical protein
MPLLTPVHWERGALVRRMIRRLVGEVHHRKANALSLRYKDRFNPDLGCSQSGEDGIIQEIVRRLDVERGWFVEVGAWDGVLYSNTYALVQQGWRGVGIECDAEKFRALQRNMRDVPGYLPICTRVSRDGDRGLDAVLAGTLIPHDFALLSIDIDGNDYWIWDSLRDYRPAVVVVEYNPRFSAAELKVMPFDDSHVCDEESGDYGASAAALEKLGRSKGYRLVAYTGFLNLFFVREDLAHGKFERLPVTCVPVHHGTHPPARTTFLDV